MGYNEQLASRLRAALAGTVTSERKMFGGLAFLVNGNLCCGILGDRLMVRVGPDAHAAALALPHSKPMDFTGRPMKGMVYVEPAGIATDAALSDWARRGVAFAASLPAK
jgi:TfoX/Sxy family transcriptional regulator of competence genes